MIVRLVFMSFKRKNCFSDKAQKVLFSFLNKSTSESGQISIEFIITILIVLGIFIFGLYIFQNRTSLNYVSDEKWSSQNVAFEIARNINNAYLLDDNSVVTSTIVWKSDWKSVYLEKKSVVVSYQGTIADAPIATSNVEWRITDLNGLIYFHKINGRVVVDYS